MKTEWTYICNILIFVQPLRKLDDVGHLKIDVRIKLSNIAGIDIPPQ